MEKKITCPTCYGARKTIIKGSSQQTGHASISEICRSCQGAGTVAVQDGSLSESSGNRVLENRLND